MDVGLAKAWVEELRTRFANKRCSVSIQRRNIETGVLKEIFYIDKEVHITFIKDGDLYASHYRVRLTNEWNDNEIRWSDHKTPNGFICDTTDGQVRFELDALKSAVASVLEGVRANLKLNNRKGLAPGLQLVSLGGRKGVAPSLLKK